LGGWRRAYAILRPGGLNRFLSNKLGKCQALSRKKILPSTPLIDTPGEEGGCFTFFPNRRYSSQELINKLSIITKK
jgi:hypothetical protein